MNNESQHLIAAVFIVLTLAGYASVILACLFWSMWDRYQGWRDRKMDAKIDALFKEHDDRRASSSIGREQPTLNRQVPGSSPGGLTRRENPLPMRITWHLEERTAIAVFPNEIIPVTFKWRDLPRPRDEKVIPQAGITRFRDFRPGENKVQLIWDGTSCEKFVDEVQLKLFLIRFVYNIDQRFLVPSELLADANLVYETGDWVDEWFCTDQNDEIIECPREIYRPTDRKIRHNHIKPRVKPKITHQVVKRSDYRQSQQSLGYEIPARVEIDRLTDEECFFHFKAGGFYEKKEAASCGKGEKAV